MSKTIIIGGGVSGLTAAHRLQQQGRDVCVLESSPRVGGAIETSPQDGFLFERGPNSFMDNEPAMMDLCHELRLENRLLKQSMRGNKRYIFLNGALQEAPMGPGGLYKTPLLSGAAKRGLLAEPFRRSNRNVEDEPLADFVRRRLGKEVLDNMVTPFVSGVYAGDPEKLSLRSSFSILYDLERQSGSLVLGGLSKAFAKKDPNKPKKPRSKNLCSFIDGMDELPRALSASLGESLRVNAPVSKVEQNENGGWRVFVEGDANPIEGGAVIATAPAYTLGELLKEQLPKTADYFKTITYNRMVVMGLGFQRADIEHPCDGFGYLVPRRQGPRFLGSIWSSTLFPLRAPGGCIAFTCFIGGGLDPEAYDMSDDDLRSTVMRDLHLCVGVKGEPVAEQIVRWHKAIPQYPVGHHDRLETLAQELKKAPGLFITGNFTRGVSVNDCIRNARQTADAVAAFLPSAPAREAVT
ncbi:MAG: protoporphyrinogen oxidase [Candidatus Hinthialibacter antarcticus]|nr:protoporphyrinogen oxidase [Candidatus Hinthialibacter antarcticus]